MRQFAFYIMTIFFLTSAYAEQVSFESEAQYKKNLQDSFSNLPVGESIQLRSGESILGLTKAGIPLLIVSTSNDNSKIFISDANLNSLIQDRLQPLIESSTSEIIDVLRKAEVLIQKRDYSQALSLINPIKQKYKNISSLLFMSGTIFYLMNNKTSAIEDLQNGLKIESNNEPAKKLLAQLKGGT